MEHLGREWPTTANEGAVISTDCNLCANVTIDGAGLDGRRGEVRIGRQVSLARGAVISGPVVIGDDVALAAGAVVIADVRASTTVAGNLATVAARHGTRGLGLHQRPRWNY